MPTKYRDEINADHGGRMTLTVDHEEQCLVLYSMTMWEKTVDKIMSLPNLSTAVRGIKRLVLGHANEVEMDGQGRIMLAAPLREYSGMEKRIALIGQVDKFELWDADVWDVSRESLREAAPINIKNDDSLKGFSI